jgi:hypothetical protein
MVVNTSIGIGITIGNYIWGISTDDMITAETTSGAICLADFPSHLVSLPLSPCLTTLLAKLLGFVIIVGACLNKAPIIRNVLHSKSVAGLSLRAMYGEVLMYGNSALYGYLQQAPFTAYGENLMVTLQCVVLVWLVWGYMDQDGTKPAVSLVHKGMVVGVGTAYVTLIVQHLSPEYYSYVIMSNWPALLFSRGSQILQSYQQKHTGAQSVVTHGMNLTGSLIRIGTTIGEVGYDFALLSGYAISIALNLVLVAQVWLYQEHTAQVLAQASAAKTRKKKE